MTVLTEEEAKAKWCPFARTYDARGPLDQPVTINRGSGSYADPDCLCIGSDCMAWRFGKKRNPAWLARRAMMSKEFEEHPADRAPPYVDDTEVGYCGLAGRTA